MENKIKYILAHTDSWCRRTYGVSRVAKLMEIADLKRESASYACYDLDDIFKSLSLGQAKLRHAIIEGSPILMRDARRSKHLAGARLTEWMQRDQSLM